MKFEILKGRRWLATVSLQQQPSQSPVSRDCVQPRWAPLLPRQSKQPCVPRRLPVAAIRPS